MKYYLPILCLLLYCACTDPAANQTSAAGAEGAATAHSSTVDDADFEWNVERVADIRILRYQIPGFDQLSLSQKQLVYYLTQAGLAGRDIIYDQNYRHNLEIRQALEKILSHHRGQASGADWEALQTYAKRFFFANGLHHHYSKDKFEPGFSQAYFESLFADAGVKLSKSALRAIFDPTMDAKKVSLDPEQDLILSSAVNFYGPDITEAEVEAFYQERMANKDPERPISYGLNSKLVRQKDGSLTEAVWSAQGRYAPAIQEIQKWLRLAAGVAENEASTCWSATTKPVISKPGMLTTSPGWRLPKAISITSMVLWRYTRIPRGTEAPMKISFRSRISRPPSRWPGWRLAPRGLMTSRRA